MTKSRNQKSIKSGFIQTSQQNNKRVLSSKEKGVLLDVQKQVSSIFQQRLKETQRTRKSLAHEVGQTGHYVTMVLAGEQNFSVSSFAKLCVALNLSPCIAAMKEGADQVYMNYEKIRSSDTNNKKRCGSFTRLLQEAETYIFEILTEMCPDKFRIQENAFEIAARNLMQTKEESFGSRKGSIETETDPDSGDERIKVEVIRSNEKSEAANFIIRIVPEFTFDDGFSDVEWVLYSEDGKERFRSQDLSQVASLAGIIISRRCK